MFETIHHNGLTCWADSLRKIGYGGLALLSVFGHHNAVRAVWAALVGAKRRRQGSIHVGDQYLCCVEDATYVTIQTPLGGKQTHLVLLHTSATQQASMFEESFLQVGPNAELRYFQRLTHLCPVPMRVEWRDEIWRLGCEAQLITLLEGFGLPLYSITTAQEKWVPVIRNALLQGTLR